MHDAEITPQREFHPTRYGRAGYGFDDGLSNSSRVGPSGPRGSRGRCHAALPEGCRVPRADNPPAPLEAERAKCSEALGNADAEIEVVTDFLPALTQRSEPLLHLEGHRGGVLA